MRWYRLRLCSHEYCILLDDQRGRLEREFVYSVDEILVQHITVLVLFDRRVEEGGTVAKAEFAHGLLDEVKMLLLVVVVSF
jgi:hypothetical protein